MSQELEALASQAAGHGLRPFWQLEQPCHFLNHGSFGATPRNVLAAQDAWRAGQYAVVFADAGSEPIE